MMDSSPSKVNAQPTLPAVAGTKRPAPTLLPAFEPLPSSSPSLPGRNNKRVRTSSSEFESAYKYPTPIPTSTTGILSSSPPGVHARAGLHRTRPSIERAPLSAVPTITIPEDGQTLLMGRSSNSSHYQLSANRLISRVHIKARYISATVPLEANKIEIICCGWNGVKLHCHGRTWELAKGDSFTSETENAEIMLDVQDARVLVAWPQGDHLDSAAATEVSSWSEDSSPRGKVTAVTAQGDVIHSSPIRRVERPSSPVSPTPARQPLSSTNLANLFPDDAEKTFIHVYEDNSEPEPAPATESKDPEPAYSPTVAATSFNASFPASQESELSEPEEDPEEDPDEENDPIVHSFGPYGANLSSRMAQFTAGRSPEARGRNERESKISPEKRLSSTSTEEGAVTPVINHVANQLAYSRLQSMPLSTILRNLPANLRGISPSKKENKGLAKEDLRKMLNRISFIGEIHREGKDAAGKPLESEYYYIPDEDTDQSRKETVQEGLRKPSLRNCRKQHKVLLIHHLTKDVSNSFTAILLEASTNSINVLEYDLRFRSRKESNCCGKQMLRNFNIDSQGVT
ncbi:target of SBF [Ciborinia camelliae]|nr:target of SBF [Ciborinia camelliae]